MRGRRGQREEAEGFGLSGESLGAEEEGGAKIFWTLPAPNSALAAISLLGPGPGVDGSQRTGNCPPHSPPRKSCPRCPPRQSDSRSPPQRLRERGGCPHLHPEPCWPSDWASHRGSGPHGSGPGPRETPAAGAQGPPPRGGGCGRLGGGGAAEARQLGAAEGRCPRGLGAAGEGPGPTVSARGERRPVG